MISYIATALLLAAFHFLTGWGLLLLLNIKLKPWPMVALSTLLGIAVFSLIPFILQLLYIPLNSITVFSALAITCLAFNVQFKRSFANLETLFSTLKYKFKLYEIGFIVLIAFIVFVSVWRCFYLPPTPRDLTSGSEVIAEYAVKEGSMINSVFSVNLETTNNQFKPPFIISLQIIYKLAGFPFGQVWLSMVFISFIIFLYNILNEQLHKIITGLLLLLFLAIPEMYGYTFMVLFDYSNAVFFFLSIFFLIACTKEKIVNYLILSAILMAIATYIRSETLILAFLTAPLLYINQLKNKLPIKKISVAIGLFVGLPILIYILSIYIYINHYLPVNYDVGGQVNSHLFNLSPLLQRFLDMNQSLIFSKKGITLYGYFIFIFLAMFVLELAIKRGFNKVAINWLYAILVIYLGLPILGYLLPLLDLDNSTKRGLFKIFPLMLLYLGNNQILISLSHKITKWEKSN